jgi:hypothetical protein
LGGGRTAIRSAAARCAEEEIGAEPDGGGGASNSISRSADSEALRSGAGRATLGAIGVDDGPCENIAGTIDEMNEAGSAPDAVGAARARCGGAASCSWWGRAQRHAECAGDLWHRSLLGGLLPLTRRVRGSVGRSAALDGESGTRRARAPG